MVTRTHFGFKSVGLVVACGAIFVAQPSWAQSWSGGTYSKGTSGLGVYNAPACRGVYIISVGGRPFYVGKSRDIRKRLGQHFSGAGSSAVASILVQEEQRISWEALCTDSDEQVEAQLMRRLGTTSLGNLRIEIDPGGY